jgi:hypothetical protein
MVHRTGRYAYDVGVWDVSIIQGPFSVAWCQTSIDVTIRNFCIAASNPASARVVGPQEKKQHRSFEKKIHYESRKTLAEKRPRLAGKFTKATTATSAPLPAMPPPARCAFLRDTKSSLGDTKSSLSDAKSSLGDAKSLLGDVKSSLGDAKSSLGDVKSSLGDAESSLGDAKSSLGDAESFLGVAESSLGDAKSLLVDAESSLGDAKSSLGDAKSLLVDAKSSLGDGASSLGDTERSLGDVYSRGGASGDGSCAGAGGVDSPVAAAEPKPAKSLPAKSAEAKQVRELR